MVPEWTEVITERVINGEDQLGVESAATSYQGDLMPGIITVTEHARYYSLYCWILWRFLQNEAHGRKMKAFEWSFFKNRELAHTLACHAHHLPQDDLNAVIGRLMTRREIWSDSEPMQLDRYTGKTSEEKYFGHRLGGFGQYYLSSVQVMGLMGERPNGQDVYQLTTRGIELAEAFERSIAETGYFKRLAEGEVTTLTPEEAAEYGAVGCLCAEALAQGEDLALLREMLFRLDDAPTLAQHRRRRLSLGLLLDFVQQSGEVYLPKALRAVLYLGEFAAGQTYTAAPELQRTFARWQTVAARQQFTNGLQVLWHNFLEVLWSEAAVDGMTLDGFMQWVAGEFSPDSMVMTLADYIEAKWAAVGVAGRWGEAAASGAAAYAEAVKFKQDALTLFEEKAYGVTAGFDMLLDLFLRFYPLHRDQDEIWLELATNAGDGESHRLPLQRFFIDMVRWLNGGTAVGEVLTTIFQNYILAQHEYVAIRKLRYNGYDTFKFNYIEGRFYRPFKAYEQPLRHPSLRLENSLTMLIDVGLVIDDGTQCYLSEDGQQYLTKVRELAYVS